MSPPLSVALAGATGNLGTVVLSTLLAAGHHITILTRQQSTSTSSLPTHPNLTIHPIDFSSSASITPILLSQNITVVIACVATLAIGSQNALIDASVTAGVRLYIPAEFGMDSGNALCGQLPVCRPKVETQRYLQAKVRENPSFGWMGVANGLFLDWGLEVGFIIDVGKRETTLWNGGDVKFSVTTLGDVAKVLLKVVENRGEGEEMRNRVLCVHSAVVTQNQLIRYAVEKDGREWVTKEKATGEVLVESFELLEKGEDQLAMDGFCRVASWDEKYGGNFEGRADNTLVGLEMMEEEEVRKLVETCL